MADRGFGLSPRPMRRSESGARRGGSRGFVALVATYDFVLVVAMIALAGFGILMVTSATRDTQLAAGYDPYLYLKKQAVFVALGLVAMVVVTVVDYRKYLDYSPAMYTVSLLALIAVLFAPAHNGAHGWFELGQFQLQPSEFSKLVLIVTLAAYGNAQRHALDGRRVFVIIVIAAVPIGLIFLEPDLGGALVFSVILAAMLWVAGAQPRLLGRYVLVGAALGWVVVKAEVLKDYQIKRLTSFVGAPVYNVKQSKVAIGSGGLTGRGLFAGTQTRYGYVPERHTDFIFSVVGEQLGVIGSGVLLLVLLLLCWRILRIASNARDIGGSLIATGVLAIFLFQIFENIGMTMQIMPVTGIPLPLVSYGGSSTIMEFMALGLVLNVGRHRHR